MNSALVGQQKWSPLFSRTWLTWLGAGAGVILVGILLWNFTGGLGSSAGNSHAAASATEEAATADEPAKTEVKLSPEKLAAAGIEVQLVQQKEMRQTKTVSGTIEYEPAMRLELTTPVDCLVEDVLVQPGQSVKENDRLAVLVSEEIGGVRDEIGRMRDELQLKQRASDNADEILKNVNELLPLLETTTNRVELQKLFSGRRLGEHREHLFVAYAKLATAQEIWSETEALAQNGTLAGRTAQQRKSDLEIARIGTVTQRETTLFECQQARDLAAAEVAHAQRQLEISQAKLKTLLGSLQIEIEQPMASSENLSRMTIIAPQAGKIEDQLIVKHQRLKAGEHLLVIGDTSRLRLSAMIHERDWPATRLQPGEVVQFRLPALTGEQFTAKVLFVGATVQPETRSVPLVAQTDNKDGILKPGMFAWVDLPIEAEHQTLVVPTSAVTYHDAQPFVFVEIDPLHFRRVDVQLSHGDENLVEVVSGITTGQRIATKGVFQLKSELLLEQEE